MDYFAGARHELLRLIGLNRERYIPGTGARLAVVWEAHPDLALRGHFEARRQGVSLSAVSPLSSCCRYSMMSPNESSPDSVVKCTLCQSVQPAIPLRTFRADFAATQEDQDAHLATWLGDLFMALPTYDPLTSQLAGWDFLEQARAVELSIAEEYGHERA